MGCLLECENPPKDTPTRWDRCATNSGIDEMGPDLPRRNSKHHPYRHQPNDLHIHQQLHYSSSSEHASEGHHTEEDGSHSTRDRDIHGHEAFPKLVVTNSNSIHSRTSQNSNTIVTNAYRDTRTNSEVTSAGSVAVSTNTINTVNGGNVPNLGNRASNGMEVSNRSSHRSDGDKILNKESTPSIPSTTPVTVTIPTTTTTTTHPDHHDPVHDQRQQHRISSTATATIGTVPTDAIVMNICRPSPTPPPPSSMEHSQASTERSALEEERHLQLRLYTESHHMETEDGLQESPQTTPLPQGPPRPIMTDDASITLTMDTTGTNLEISVSQFVPNQMPKSAPVGVRGSSVTEQYGASYNHYHQIPRELPHQLMKYRSRSPSTPSRRPRSVTDDEDGNDSDSEAPPFLRTHSADPDRRRKRSGKMGKKRKGRMRSQSKPTVMKTQSVPALDATSTPSMSKLSVYSFNSFRDGKINVNKTKHRLVHAKSREIPQHQFSSSLMDHQDEESNRYHYLASITHFDINTLRLLHLRFNRIDTLSTAPEETLDGVESEDEQREDVKGGDAASKSNEQLDINAMAKLFGLPAHCLLVRMCLESESLSDLAFHLLKMLTVFSCFTWFSWLLNIVNHGNHSDFKWLCLNGGFR